MKFKQIIYNFKWKKVKPTCSLVLTNYLKQTNEPPWTSYFVKYSSVVNDQRGQAHFNWKVGNSNYHILRTGCYPYIKYHCTKRPYEDLSADNTLMRVIKVLNLGKHFDSCCVKLGLNNSFIPPNRHI